MLCDAHLHSHLKASWIGEKARPRRPAAAGLLLKRHHPSLAPFKCSSPAAQQTHCPSCLALCPRPSPSPCPLCRPLLRAGGCLSFSCDCHHGRRSPCEVRNPPRSDKKYLHQITAPQRIARLRVPWACPAPQCCPGAALDNILRTAIFNVVPE